MDKVLNLREIKEIALDELFHANYGEVDALEAETDKRVRRVNLDKAVTLGRSVKIKTRLVIKTVEGYVQVKGIVHFVADKGITLEKDHFIPMHAIHSVDLY
jgi:hypothetical protein